MTNIKLTSDGYSFHTVELKTHPGSKAFHRALSSLYAAAKRSKDRDRTTYPLSNYQNGAARPHCSTMLSRHGILLYLTETVKNGWLKYTIKAVINPRKVLDPDSDYLGIAPTDEESLELLSDEFTLLMRKYHLPEFMDEWTLTRLDLCVNLLLNKKKSAREFCRLLQKDLLPHKMERIHFFDPMAPKKDQKEQKDKDWHSICLANDSYQIVVYDKLFQIKTEGLSESGSWSKLPDGVLRLELRCYPPYLKKLFDGKRQHTVSEQLRWLTLHSRELILKKAAHAFSSGTHYKPSTAEALIEGSPYHKNTRRQLWWLFKRMRYPFDLEQLEKGMKKQFGLSPRATSKRLEQLQALGINLIPLRKDFYLEQLPSLPLVLKLLEDDTTTVKLASDGTVEY